MMDECGHHGINWCMHCLLGAAGAIHPFFILLTVVLLAVVVVSLVLVRFKQSLLVGYFICGVVIRNSGLLDWVGVEQAGVIDALAEIGVVLLLFTLGIEFSVKEIKALRRPVFLGGGSQVGLCILVAVGGGMIFGLTKALRYTLKEGSWRPCMEDPMLRCLLYWATRTWNIRST